MAIIQMTDGDRAVISDAVTNELIRFANLGLRGHVEDIIPVLEKVDKGRIPSDFRDLLYARLKAVKESEA